MIIRALLAASIGCLSACNSRPASPARALVALDKVAAPPFATPLGAPLSRAAFAASAMDNACNGSIGGISAFQHGTDMPVAFSTTHAFLLLRTAPTKSGLANLLQKAKLELANDSENGGPPCFVHGESLPSRSKPPDLLKHLVVKIRKHPDNDALLSGAHRTAKFCSDPSGKQAMEFIDSFMDNLAHQPGGLPPELDGAVLAPDYATVGYQLLDTTGTDAANASTYEDAANKYWRRMDLFAAWQLNQVAARPTTSKVIRAAIVDFGFHKDEHNMIWDQHDDADSTDHVFGTAGDSDQPYHGSKCGSALNATVSDGPGASGSALFGSASAAPILSSSAKPIIRTIAVQPPDIFQSSISQMIECAIWKGGADVVSVSRGTDCVQGCKAADDDLASVLSYAADNSVAVFFAAGQDSRALDPATTSDQPHYQWGCQTAGALCVGGIDVSGQNASMGVWKCGANSQDECGSNYGGAVDLWGPGQGVPVNYDPDAGAPVTLVSGTSMATPFIAGMVALAEVTWGKTYNNTRLAGVLSNSGVQSTDPVKAGNILQGYRLVQTSPDGAPVTIAPDRRDTGGHNDTLAAAKGGSQPTADELLTLDNADDVDFLPIVQAAAGPRKIRFKYIADIQDLRILAENAPPPPLRATLQTESGIVVPENDLKRDGDNYPNIGIEVVSFDSLPAGKYFLRVSATGNQTTAYTVDINDMTPTPAVHQ